LATAAFDDKDDNFGTMAAKVAHGASQLGDPFFNQQTWTGAAFGKTMEGLNHVYREGVSEPLVAANTMAGHTSYQLQHGEGIGDLFNSQEWGKAYKVAHRSIGQSRVLFDPFNGNQTHDDGTFSATTVMLDVAATGAGVTNTVPMTANAGDLYSLAGTYEAA
jgi:hypothetical protein